MDKLCFISYVIRWTVSMKRNVSESKDLYTLSPSARKMSFFNTFGSVSFNCNTHLSSNNGVKQSQQSWCSSRPKALANSYISDLPSRWHEPAHITFTIHDAETSLSVQSIRRGCSGERKLQDNRHVAKICGCDGMGSREQ